MNKLKKMLGPSAGWQVNDRAPDAEERAALTEQLQRVKADAEAAKLARDARRAELLADPEYRALSARADALAKQRNNLFGRTHLYRFTAGTMNSVFFSVRAQGDTWEEVFAKLADRK